MSLTDEDEVSREMEEVENDDADDQLESSREESAQDEASPIKVSVPSRRDETASKHAFEEVGVYYVSGRSRSFRHISRIWTGLLHTVMEVQVSGTKL
jgi:hypothetical protein